MEGVVLSVLESFCVSRWRIAQSDWLVTPLIPTPTFVKLVQDRQLSPAVCMVAKVSAWTVLVVATLRPVLSTG